MERCDYCNKLFSYELKTDREERKICGPCYHKLPKASTKPGPPKGAKRHGKPLPRKARSGRKKKTERGLSIYDEPLPDPPPLERQTGVYGLPPGPPRLRREKSIYKKKRAIDDQEDEKKRGGPSPAVDATTQAQPASRARPRAAPPQPLPEIIPAEMEEGYKLGNVSSRVPREQIYRFVLNLVKTLDLGFPIFSVSDCNSFHTSGYLWGLYAALKLRQEGCALEPVAVVNFDFHADLGSSGKPYTGSDTWGNTLTDEIASLGFPVCYLSIFNTPGSAIECTYKPRPPESEEKKEHKQENELEEKQDETMSVTIKESLKYIRKVCKEHFGGKPIRYVFVTIDRDVLKNSYTQWGDGPINDIGALKKELLSLLEGLGVCKKKGKPGQAELIGFDVSGLPEHAYMLPRPKKETVKEVYRRVTDELNILQNIASTDLNLPLGRNALSSALLFSGSTSYTGPQDEEKHTAEQMTNEMKAWNYKDFLLNAVNYLQPWLQKAKPISYILNKREPPIYAHGMKSFSVHPNKPALQRGAELEALLKNIGPGIDVGGFPSTAAISDPPKLCNYYHYITTYDTNDLKDAETKYSSVKWSQKDKTFVPHTKEKWKPKPRKKKKKWTRPSP